MGLAEIAETARGGKAAGHLALAPRPAPLFPLFASVKSLKGVKEAIERLLADLLDRPQPRVIDLLSLAPQRWIDPAPLTSLLVAKDGEPVTLDVLVLRHRPAATRTRPHVIAVEAADETVDLVFFGSRPGQYEGTYPEGERRLVHGRLMRFRDAWQLNHPELLPTAASRPVPVYGAVGALGQGRLRRAMATALAALPDLPEWLDPDVTREHGWPGWAMALATLHHPESMAAAGADAPARQRLAYDELLASQLALALTRRRRAGAAGRSLAGDGSLGRRLRTLLPFPLTGDQDRAILEVADDLRKPVPMTRLLQGDVGSGKTLVALMAMLQAVEAGAQAALMAPTEVLARQHHAVLGRLTAELGYPTDLLTGSEPAARRRTVNERLASGAGRLVVGTHALFQEAVSFKALGLVVIDEQHRFGVAQRLALLDKGEAVDLLLMTATPIPRTALLAAYGDVATSRLREKPPGRLPVATHLLQQGRLDELLEGIGRLLDAGERIFWICPMIEESETEDQAAALARFTALRERFGDLVGLVHGRLKGPDKAAQVEAFARGGTRLLVATTVVEVGVDVADAGVIVIEDAQRFGLAQLHQLRGRVGRGGQAAQCILVYRAPLGAVGKARLKVLKGTNDGFRIAEEDLRLRGPGEVLGTRQSGLPVFRFADLARDGELLELAQADARSLLDADPNLARGRGPALRLLLHLFERQEAIALLAAG